MNKRNADGPSSQRNMVLLALGGVLLLAAGLLALLLPANAPGGDAPESRTAVAGEAVRVGEGAELLQTLTYTRCAHVVTRRVTAPVELYGKTHEEVQPLYDEWRITEFSPLEIKMEKRPELFCPDHVVLMPNAAGKLCVFENKYGDALALVSELQTELSSLPAAVQEDATEGMGFSTLTELEQWLESAES